MRVKTCANVDVECEVDVDLNEVLREFAEQMEECDKHKLPIRIAGTMDQLTRVLASISDEMIAAMKPAHIAVIRDRLVTESARYPIPVTEAARMQIEVD